MWNELESEIELEVFLRRISCFHDSCLKSFSYVSGAYVSPDLSMYPLNDKRTLNMIFQRQSEDVAGFELEFYGLRSFNFVPTDPRFTCEIEAAKMFFKDGYIHFENDSCRVSEENGRVIVNSVCADGCRWREI